MFGLLQRYEIFTYVRKNRSLLKKLKHKFQTLPTLQKNFIFWQHGHLVIMISLCNGDISNQRLNHLHILQG